MLYTVVLTFEPVDKTLKCDHSNESSTFLWSVYCAAQHENFKLHL